MITNFRVQNYKALRDVSLELTRMHVLIGPNDSGKTSILEAIMALCRSVDHPLSESFVGTWDGTSLVSRGVAADTVVLQSSFGEECELLSYELKCAFPSSGTGIAATREVVTLNSATIPFEAPPHRSYSFVGGQVRQPDHHRRFSGTDLERFASQVHGLLAGVQFFRFNPSTLSLPVAADSNRHFRMEPDGFGLALCLDNILGHDRQHFEQLESSFRRIFPQIKSIKLKPQKALKAPVDDARLRPSFQEAEGKGLYFTFENGTGDVAAEQMSDGVLLVLAYLTVLYSPDPPRVLLVEEPENGIHPHRLNDVLGILRQLVDAQQRTQVIITTHSPYVVDLFEPSQVTLCRQEHGEVSITRLADSSMVRKQLDVFTLGEIWTSEGDEALAQ